MLRFIVIRILAGELPPRDEPGGRLAALRMILECEPPLRAARKLFLLNAIHDRAQHEARIEILAAHGAEWREIEFDRMLWKRAKTTRQRLCAALGINQARNLAIDIGRSLAAEEADRGSRDEGRGGEDLESRIWNLGSDAQASHCLASSLGPRSTIHTAFVLPLDGECFFTRAAWQRFRRDVAADQRAFPQRRYYSLPMYRVPCDPAAIQRLDVATATPEEPQLAFRHDAPRRFDETRPWGDQPKLALLAALGHRKGAGPAEFWPRKRHCAPAGWVYHLATCPLDSDENIHLRANLRQQAAQRLLARIELAHGE